MTIKLRELRERKGLSMREAAKQLGLAPSTYYNYETGEREPNSEMLIKLANYYNCSIDYLIGNETHRSEAEQIADMLKHRPDLRSVFNLLTDATKDDVDQVVRIIKAIK